MERNGANRNGMRRISRIEQRVLLFTRLWGLGHRELCEIKNGSKTLFSIYLLRYRFFIVGSDRIGSAWGSVFLIFSLFILCTQFFFGFFGMFKVFVFRILVCAQSADSQLVIRLQHMHMSGYMLHATCFLCICICCVYVQFEIVLNFTCVLSSI